MTTQKQKMQVKIGLGSCGIAAGARKVEAAFQERVAELGLDVTVGQVGCLGMCFAEPMLEIIDGAGEHFLYGRLDAAAAVRLVDEHLQANQPVADFLLNDEDMSFLTRQTRLALRNCGIVDPENIEEYVAHGGYTALTKCYQQLTPEQVIATIKESGLRGRGGAGFPTWFKWNAARAAAGAKKYVICNADEGDPGAFMDRSLLESDPHSVLEGMMIAAYAIGADEGIIYVRAEYPLSIHRLEIALAAARERGYLGDNILDSGRHFDVRIKAGAGAFVCGEETALLASLEGERGMPRIKPPFPAEKGYWQQPSNINNVETYANVPLIIAQGAAVYNSLGTEDSKGTKVFALAGKIKRGGLVEVPMGLTLRQVVMEIGGGMQQGKACKAVQMGGPSGGCIPESLMDTPIDYASIAKTGAIMGSGGMIAMDESTCMVDMARFFLDFTQKESCGKCVHCRIGTKRMLEILTRITQGEGELSDLDKLEELGKLIIDGSLCGLGNSAPNPALSTLRYFRAEYEAHIVDKRCPAANCPQLLTYTVNQQCSVCGVCQKRCPVAAIERVELTAQEQAEQAARGARGRALTHKIVIDNAKCSKCGTCLNACRFDAISVE